MTISAEQTNVRTPEQAVSLGRWDRKEMDCMLGDPGHAGHLRAVLEWGVRGQLFKIKLQGLCFQTLCEVQAHGPFLHAF